MKVIKKINNNFAVCLDSSNNELIAYGKGIGFPKTPYELDDLSIIDRSFYGINSIYFNLINEIPEEIFKISSEIVDFARMTIENELNQNIVFTLADHINFAIKRYNEGMNLKMSLGYEVKHLYEAEMNIGNEAIKIIKKRLSVCLPSDEAVSIALHFINAEKTQQMIVNQIEDSVIIKDIIDIIENYFSITINQDGSHMQYLLKRRKENKCFSSDNHELYNIMKVEFKEVYLCTMSIKNYLFNNLDWKISEEELVYIMLHINRLCVREDCNQ